MKALFVVAWLVLLGAPLFATLVPVVQEAPLQENRVLAKLPVVTLRSLAHGPATLKLVFDWFNDNFGFRRTLIRVRTVGNYAFGYATRVHIGPDGWLYYRSVLDTEKVAVARLSPADVDAVRDRFLRLRDHLASRGVRLIVVSVPQKDDVYPECLGRDVPTFARPTAFERLRASLTQALGADHVDGQEILTRARGDGLQVFHRTDFHWTDVGGGEVARAIVNRVADVEGRPELRWTAPLPTEPMDLAGGESQQLPMFHYVHERSVGVPLDWRDEKQGSFAQGAGEDFVWTSRRERPTLPPLAIAHNSYGDAFWRTGMHFHFEKVYVRKFTSKDGSFLAGVLRGITPDTRYFVLQFFEAELPTAGLVRWSDLGL